MYFFNLFSLLFIITIIIFGYYKNFKYILLNFFLIGCLFTLVNTHNYFIIYITIEVMSYIFLFIYLDQKIYWLNLYTSIIYYLILSGSSLLFIIFFYLILQNNINSSIFILYSHYNIFLFFYCFIKLGLHPFSDWIIKLLYKSNWYFFTFYSSLSKFPFIFILILLDWNILYLILIYISLLYFSICILKEINFKKIIIFSSLIHLCFIIIINILEKTNNIKYILLYLILYIGFLYILLNFCYLLRITKYTTFNEFYSLKYKNVILSFLLILALVSLWGLPFLTGFSLKYYLFYNLLQSNYLVTNIFLFIIVILNIFYILLLLFNSLGVSNSSFFLIKSLLTPLTFNLNIYILSFYSMLLLYPIPIIYLLF